MSAPTVAEVAAALGATLLAGDDAALGRDVLDFVVGAAHVPTLLGHLTEGALVITPGDRADLLVAASAAHVAGQVSVAGLVLTLGEQPDPRVMRLVEGLNTGLAVLSVRSDSYDTVAASSRIEGRPSAANPRKVEAALGAFERCVDTDDLARRLRVSRSTRVTPLMFENELIDRARSQPPAPGAAGGHRGADPARGGDPAAPWGGRADAAGPAGRHRPAHPASWASTSATRSVVDPGTSELARRLRRRVRAAARPPGRHRRAGARHRARSPTTSAP